MSLSILIVDDEPELRDLTASKLRRNGYIVHEAQSALDAITLIDSILFDLAVIDYELGTTMTGFDIAKHLAKKQPTAHLVLITGYDPKVFAPKVENPLNLFRVVVGKGEPNYMQKILRVAERVEESKEDTQP